MRKLVLALIAIAPIFSFLGRLEADIITQWTFESSVPTTGGPLSPEVGLGTATSNTGGTFSNPAGWGSVESWSSNGWDVGDYFQFQVSTTGYQGITLGWQQTGSNTGPANFTLQYSTDGTSFTNFGNYGVTNDGWNTTLTPAASEKSFDLSSILGLNNAPTAFFRLVVADTTSINGGTVASTGTGRVDNFTVNGSLTAIPEPSSMALLGLVGVGGMVVRKIRRKKLA